jgi:hypothetical protein
MKKQAKKRSRVIPEQRAAARAHRKAGESKPKFSFNWYGYPYSHEKHGPDMDAEPRPTKCQEYADEAEVKVRVHGHFYLLETRLFKSNGRWSFPGAERDWALASDAANNLWKTQDVREHEKVRKARKKQYEAQRAALELVSAIARFEQHHLPTGDAKDKLARLAKTAGEDVVDMLDEARARIRSGLY